VAEHSDTKKGWIAPTWRHRETYGYLPELYHFVRSVAKGEMPRETFRDGYVVNLMVDAAYRSVKTGRWEPLTKD
jgi:predicted dehydrogenase